jgi:aspartyl-tRNA synthetase
MSFVTQEDVWDTMEPVIAGVFEEFADGKPVTQGSFPRIPYDEAMRKYGSDKPDLRNPIEMQDVTEHFAGSGFKVFAGIVESGGEVWAIPAPGAAGQPQVLRRHEPGRSGEGQPASAISSGARKASRAGRLPRTSARKRTEAIRTQLGLGPNDACSSLRASPSAQAYKFAGEARIRVGES